jgi:hypothetical protein
LNQQNKTSKKKSFKPTKNKQTKDSLKAFSIFFHKPLTETKTKKKNFKKQKKQKEKRIKKP